MSVTKWWLRPWESLQRQTRIHDTTEENCIRYVHLMLSQLGYDIDWSFPSILMTAVLSSRERPH